MTTFIKSIFEEYPHVQSVWVNPEDEKEYSFHFGAEKKGWSEVKRSETKENKPAPITPPATKESAPAAKKTTKTNKSGGK